jgi:hypothetical protein
VRLPGRLSALSLLAAAALAVAAAPASADPVLVLTFDQVSGTQNGRHTLPYQTPGIPLLDHFDFRFVNDDKHLQFLTVLPRGTNNALIDVDFSDFNGDDSYEYRIAHQRVSATGLNLGTFTDTCRGQCTKTIVRPPGNVEFVIRGFDFKFTGGDHHIDSIGILEDGTGKLTHYFNDKNNDDEYTVQIDYAWVPRSRFSVVSGLADDRVHGTGTATRDIPAGNKVIKGFWVDNIGSGGGGDNHIKGFGFLTNDTTVDIHYGDKDPADSADWRYQLNYGVLN